MKITRIQTYVLKVPLREHRFYSSQCAFPERNSLLVRIDTDAGITGWGEGGQYGPAEPVAACINSVLKARLIGENPEDVQVLWEKGYAGTRDFGQRGSYIEAISAIDIALWDILGKASDKPIYQLLGGAFRRDVTAYATGCYYRGEDVTDHSANMPSLADEAKGFIDAGFDMMKMKVGLLSIDADYERVMAVKQAIGKATLLVDANHAYNLPNALKMGKHLEEAHVGWFEEPVVPEDLNGYQTLKQQLNVPIAGGECVYTRYGFRDLINKDCVDFLQPNVAVCGGLSEFTVIRHLASTYGLPIVPHCWGSGVALAATLQGIATLPPTPHTANPVALQNEPVIEFDQNINPLRDHLINEPFALKDGKVSIPDRPGLGITINEDVLQRYSATTP